MSDLHEAMRRAMQAQGLADPDEVFAIADTIERDDGPDRHEPPPIDLGQEAFAVERDDIASDWEAPGQQLPLDVPSDMPGARATDPDTSKRAGEIGRMRGSSMRAKLLLAFYDARYEDGLLSEQAAAQSNTLLRRGAYGETETEYSKRCSELKEAGLIQPTGKERTGASGHKREVFEITGIGMEFVRERGWR